MRHSARLLVTAALLFLPAPSMRAQMAVDPSGHWEGAIQAEGRTASVEVDLAKNTKGELVGTISIPAQNLKGLPLSKVAVDGRSVTFQARADQPLTGLLSDDGQAMSVELRVSGHSIPFSMTRTGEARIEAPARSAPISKALEGTWNGTLDVKGMQLRLVLTMSNQPDGGATASVVNLDQGSLEVPVSTITQADSNVTLDFESVGASYTGALNKEGTELIGTYSQGPASAPLTFRLVKPSASARF